MKKCSICKRKFPEYLINYLMSGEINIWCCPICGLRLRNEMHGLPKDTPFHGEMAKQNYEVALEFLDKKKKKEK